MKRALVIDASVFARRNFTSVLEKAGFDVMTTGSGKNGLRMASSLDPDLITLDMGIPDMGGLACLDELTGKKWRPVVVTAEQGEFSDLLSKAVRVHGAAAAVQKPSAWDVVHDARAVSDLVRTVTRASSIKSRPRPLAAPQRPAFSGQRPSQADTQRPDAARRAAGDRPVGSAFPIFLIGSSTGGPNTLHYIMTRLPAGFAGTIVIAQHMPKRFTTAFAERMNKAMKIPVQEVEEATEIRAGHCYVAAGGQDCVFTNERGRIVIAPEPPTSEAPWCPSVDRMVETAMKAVPVKRLRAVQLTGIGNDGARAMTELHARGAQTIAESKDSSVVFGMPGNLIAMGGASMVLHHHEIANGMMEIL